MRGQWRRRKGKYYYMEKRKNKKTIFRTKRRGRSLDLLHTFKRRRSSRRRCRSIGDDARVRRSVGRQWRQWLQVARVRVCGCVCIINVGRRCCVCRRRITCVYGVRRLFAVSLFPCRNVVVVSVRIVYVHKRLYFFSPQPAPPYFCRHRRDRLLPIVVVVNPRHESRLAPVTPLPYNILTFAIPSTRYDATTPTERPGNNNTL